MLFGGARLEEVAQLAIDDIKQVDDVWCIDINAVGENKKLKNDHSERKVPIHPWLIEHGVWCKYSNEPYDIVINQYYG
jgi:integrase